MASFIFNNLLQSLLKGIARGTQNFLGDQGPFPLQFGLQILERIMRSSTGLLSRIDHNEKSKGFRSGLLERKACRTSHDFLENLKAKLQREWALIPQEVLCASCNAFQGRLKQIIKNKGGHIE